VILQASIILTLLGSIGTIIGLIGMLGERQTNSKSGG
jgi:hypothetical protein